MHLGMDGLPKKILLGWSKTCISTPVQIPSIYQIHPRGD